MMVSVETVPVAEVRRDRRVTSELRPREWTEAERRLAERRDVDLPDLDRAVVEVWRDADGRKVGRWSWATRVEDIPRYRVQRVWGRLGPFVAPLGWAVVGHRREHARLRTRRAALRWIEARERCE